MDPYIRLRRQYQDVSGNNNVLTTDTTKTLQTIRNANNQIFLQKVHIEVTAGSAGITWTLQDTAGSPILLVPSVSAASIAHYDFDFGPSGIPLTAGKSLQLSISGAGAGGWVTWEAYQKVTVVDVYTNA